MEISGRIIQVLPLQSGTSKAGNAWKKQEYVLETKDNYPRKVKFDFFGDKVDQYPLNVGEDVTVSYDLESREFNGRWYTDVRAWKAEKAGNTNTTTEINTNNEHKSDWTSGGGTQIEQFPTPTTDESDDLPF